MSDGFKDLRSLLREHPPLDFSQGQLLIRLPFTSYQNLVWLSVLMLFVIYDEIGGLLRGDSAVSPFFWIHSVFFLVLVLVLGEMLWGHMLRMGFEIFIGEGKVRFAQKRFNREVASWECPLNEYRSVNFRCCPTSNLFSVNLLHANPERTLPVAASRNEVVARGQFEELHHYLGLPVVDLVKTDTDERRSQDTMDFGPIIGVFYLIMVLLGSLVLWSKWEKIEGADLLLFGGVLGVFVVGGLTLLSPGRPWGISKAEDIRYTKILKPKLQSRIKKRYRKRIAEVQLLGFQDLCSYREELPDYSLLLGFLAHILIIGTGEMTRIRSNFRIAFLLHLLALPDRSTYVSITARGTWFITKFIDGTVVATSTHKKLGRYNWFDQDGHLCHYSTGAAISETWRQHQERILRNETEGKIEDQGSNFEEFVEIERRIYQVYLKNNWFL